MLYMYKYNVPTCYQGHKNLYCKMNNGWISAEPNQIKAILSWTKLNQSNQPNLNKPNLSRTNPNQAEPKPIHNLRMYLLGFWEFD